MAHYRKGPTEARTVKRYDHLNKLNNGANSRTHARDRTQAMLRTMDAILMDRGTGPDVQEKVKDLEALVGAHRSERRRGTAPPHSENSKRNTRELRRYITEQLNDPGNSSHNHDLIGSLQHHADVTLGVAMLAVWVITWWKERKERNEKK